jgi:hypothetical protein
MFLTEISIANAIQTKLNTLATTLYTATTINKKVVFKVFANVEDYYKITEMEYVVGDDIQYTPVGLQKVTSTMVDDFDSGFYTESYLLNVYAFEDDKVAVERIFDSYAYNENATDKEVMSGWVVKKNTSRLQFVATHTAQASGDNKSHLSYMMNFTWDFVLGGIISDDVTILINGSAVNHVQLQFETDKLSIANIGYTTNLTPVGATGFTFSITLPMQIGNTTHQSLLTDLLNKSYNKSYSVSVAFSTYYTMAYTMTLKRGSINYVRDQIISFTLTFEEALARTTVTIDSIAVPIYSFNMTSQRNIGDGLTAPSSVLLKYEIEGVRNEWRIRFGYNSAQSKNVELLRNILDSSYYATVYTLGITVAGITAKTYSVLLASGTYSFEQTGELIYECVFVESGGIS